MTPLASECCQRRRCVLQFREPGSTLGSGAVQLGARPRPTGGREMSWELALNTILGLARSRFESDSPECAVIGSVAKALQGCQVVPRDIDLLAIEPRDVYRFALWMAAHTPAQCEHPVGHDLWLSSVEMPVSAVPDDYGFFWHFSRWLVHASS